MSNEAITWYAAMFGAAQVMRTLAPEQLDDLRRWEREHLDGSGTVSTSDWPGWEPLIGPRPGQIENYRKAPIPTWLRAAVYKRDGFCCRRCGADRDLSCDHVYPERLGGATALENLQTLCRRCNSRKGMRV